MRALLLGSLALALLGVACKRPSPPSKAGIFVPVPPGTRGNELPARVQKGEKAPSCPLVRHKWPALLNVTATEVSLTPMVGATRYFSYADWAAAAFERDSAAAAKDSPGTPPRCLRELKVTPLGWVQPLLSVREEIYQSCPGNEAHPGGETRFATLEIDLHPFDPAPPRPVLLTDLFDATTLLRALRADPVIAKALAGGKTPSDLPALVRALAETSPVVSDEQCYSFPEDLLSRFVLHHQEGDQLAVRIGLPGAGPCRYALTELGLLLPIPASLARNFDPNINQPTLFFAAGAPDPAETALIKLTSGPTK